MIRIAALNEESHSSGSEDEDEPTVTKEAQETIAVSEYVRALKLKTDNHKDDACNLFRELLETEVLNINHEKKDKLFSVKYNCYKNLGFIYIELGDSDMALDYLLNAYDMDDTDVFTMNKLGQLALRMNKLEIALLTFEKCLAQNPNHWPSLEGILRVLCLKENYCEAYGWALLCYSKDQRFEFAVNVILEVRNKFKSMGLEYIENCFKIKFTDFHLKRTNDVSVFPDPIDHMEPEVTQPNFSDFKLNELTWMSTGQLIINLYKWCDDKQVGKHIAMSLDDFTSNGSVTEPENKLPDNEPQQENVDDVAMDNDAGPVPVIDISDEDKENSNSNEGAKGVDAQVVLSADGGSADDSDATKPNDTNGKSKQSRRRGSDLKFLEQWGWHKTKKPPVQRRKNVENSESEASINGILKRILAKHFEQNFDDEALFDSVDPTLQEQSVLKAAPKQIEVSPEEFQISTQTAFDEFVDEIKKSGFTILTLVLKWLKYVSRFWCQTIPKELLDVYLRVYPFYLNHYDLSAWNLLEKDDFDAAFRMTLFYLELYHDQCVNRHETEIGAQWMCLYKHTIFQSGFFDVRNDEDNLLFIESRIRVLWLQFCLSKYENDLQRTVDCIYSIKELLTQQPANYRLFFPNQKQNKTIDLATCSEMETTFERTISLNSVNALYHDNNFDQLIAILKDTIITQATQKTVDHDSPVRLSTQIEVFLESLWNIESFEDCTMWSEKLLKYAVDNYLAAPSDTFRQTEWGDMVTYILTYIEALINQESVEILLCLGKFYSRLIQSLSKIVVNQLDVPYDKNVVRAHPVSTKLPWIILYHLLQREEDLQSPQKEVSEVREDEEVEEAIPNSLMIFFTAHDFLGRHRGLCTNENGGLLLFTLDVVATRLRAPNLEQFRDIISEYLEQVTYCLYGYPSKKARSRHIGRHDAVNIELDWKRGMQLFDIYRPDNLPEFNSYKNDSISGEHEQLLQRIVVLTPVEVDPSGHTEGIRNFIIGSSKEIPVPFRLLPHRVHCIYYLLADYYFKNRDMVRSVKYYVLDLTICPTRFDSWAGLALSKSSLLEVKLNSCSPFCTKEFMSEAEEAIRCFRQCFELKERHVLLWIEYGNFAYMMHSFYSRNLKMSSDTLSMERFESMEKKKDECLTAANDCFNTVEEFVHRTDTDEDDDQDHDEKWLYHYMLGKIAEKRKDHPSVFLEHYKKSAKCLYENNASYPFRINHSNPQNLSIEALEVYYRITSSIVKYLEQHSVVTKSVGKLFVRILKEVGSSPFALNQAKIDNNSINALKRKLSIVTAEEHSAAKRRTIEAGESQKKSEPSAESSPAPSTKVDDDRCNDDVTIVDDPPAPTDAQPDVATNTVPAAVQPIDSSARRRSQESSTTNATTTTTGSDSSSSSSSESSSDSDSESDSSDDEANGERPMSDSELELIYRICIRNLEECVTRFPEHYKSIYRLANIYLHATDKVKDLKKCRQLLIGTYTTGLSNQIQGLFTDRKLNNFFSGIWRIPSSEIDRPGSFSAHMSRCIVLLMEVLLRSSDHNILLELALNLNRNPENDKRYIKEDERKELFQQGISFCIQSFRNEINAIRECPIEKRDDKSHLTLLIDIFKSHQKAIKHLLQKESVFASILIDGYKVYVEGKLEKLPDNFVVIDAAIKLCQCEIVLRKNNDKPGAEPSTESSFQNSLKMFPSLMQLSSGGSSSVPAAKPPRDDVQTLAVATTTTTTISSSTSTPIFAVPSSLPLTTTSSTVPSTSSSSSFASSNHNNTASNRRGRRPGTKNPLSKSLDWNQPKMTPTAIAAMLGIYSNPALSPTQYTSPAQVTALLEEYCKLRASVAPTSLLSSMESIAAASSSALYTAAKSFNSATSVSSKLPKFDSKKSMSSAASVLSNQTVISVGSGQLTITPSSYESSKMSKISRSNETTVINCDSDADFDIESVIPKSELLTKKRYSDMPGMNKLKSAMEPTLSGSKMAIPKDLPKSLTITPAPPVGFPSSTYNRKTMANNLPHVTLHAEPKKPKKSHKRSATVPGRLTDFSAGSQGLYGDVYQQLLNQQLNLMNMNMMPQNLVPNPLHKGASVQNKQTKTQSLNSRKEMKSTKNLPFPLPSLPDIQLSALPGNSRNFQPSPSFRANQPSNRNQAAHQIDPLKFTATPMTAHSPKKSSVLPPPIARQPEMHQASSQKTLQQKLAEQRQKSSQQESKKKE